jgi:hypothetical protein
MLTLSEARVRFGIREWWIYAWVDEGRLHAVPQGKRMTYPDWELAELVREAGLANRIYTFAGAA